MKKKGLSYFGFVSLEIKWGREEMMRYYIVEIWQLIENEKS